MKRTLGFLLALMMIVSIPAAALADTYDIADGSVSVWADSDNQRVTQYYFEGDAEEPTIVKNGPDSSPVVTGSSDQYGVSVHVNDGAEVNVTLQNVDAPSLFVDGDGDATITVEGSNTFESDSDPVVLVNDGTTTVEGSGSLTGIASGMDASGYDEEHFADDQIVTSGIHVGSQTTLDVESGTVTGINENQGLPGLNPGIGFEDGASLQVGDGVKVYDAKGKDVTAAAVADPTILNTSATSTITSVAPVRALASSALQNIEVTVKNANGEVVDAKFSVKFFDNHNFVINIYSNAGSEDLYGSFSLKDGKLVFTFRGVDYELNADNVLVLPLRNGGTVEVKLPAEVVDILLASF